MNMVEHTLELSNEFKHRLGVCCEDLEMRQERKGREWCIKQLSSGLKGHKHEPRIDEGQSKRLLCIARLQ